MSDLVQVARDGRIAVMTLNRPKQLNAIGASVLDEIDQTIDALARDDGVGAVVVTGAGRAFSAGADIAEFAILERAADFRSWIRHFTETYDRVERLPKPTIAAVEGFAFGGGFELMLACDLRIAAAGARFGLPEVKLGLLPGGGGTQRLARQVPYAVARRMVLTGEPISAEEALQFGLVNRVVDDGGTLVAAVELATTLAAGPAAAIAAGKQLLADGVTMPLDRAIVFERESVAHLFETADAREGVQAFLAKRAPNFRGTG